MNRRFKPGKPTLKKPVNPEFIKAGLELAEKPIVQRAGWSNPSQAESTAIEELLNNPNAPNAWE